MPVRYFVLNPKTSVVHIYGCCQQTKSRAVPIRLFDSKEELEAYVGRPMQLCKHCRKTLERGK